MENITLGVLGIIILANIAGIVTVLWIGGKHDAHQEMSDPSSSKALARLHADYKLAESVEPALPAAAEAAGE